MRITRPLLLAFAMAGACTGKTLDLGASAVQKDAAPPPPASVSGTWTGYIQAFQFPDGADALQIALTTNPDGTTTGTAFFGSGPPIPPPTDPNAAYPPTYWANEAGYLTNIPSEGFAFTALEIKIDGGHVRFSAASSEVWKAWCELQTTVYAVDGGHTCCASAYPDDVCDPDAQPPRKNVPKAEVCQQKCVCTPTSCTVSLSSPDKHFDLQLQGDQLTGAVSGLPPAAFYNVFLTRSR